MDDVRDLAMKIAVLMEVHAALSTTTKAKADEIEPMLRAARAERAEALLDRAVEALTNAEAALADIGDADREPGDDLAWCEARAAKALPSVRVTIAAIKESQKGILARATLSAIKDAQNG